MTHSWEKLGLLYSPSMSGRHPKLLTHAANPTPLHIEDDVYRIFYSGRDAQNRSSVGAVDIDIIERKIICEHTRPFFEHGPQGSFYADGVSIANCYSASGKRYMLFMGWQSPPNQHWRGDIGRLVVTDNLELQLDSHEPLISSDDVDPISLSYPWIVANGHHYQMWYGSTLTWDAGNGEMLHVLHYATSTNGHQWKKHGLSIPYELGIAQAFSHPTVSIDKDGFHMWFSYRGCAQTYRIGYATSENGQTWQLKLNQSGIDKSAIGWDDEMIEYPFVFDHKDKRYMLYNGNAFGKSGFGLAVKHFHAGNKTI